MNEKIKLIIIFRKEYENIIAHCKRKLTKNFRADEEAEMQAYGMIGGVVQDNVVVVKKVVEIKKNYRFEASVSNKMNTLIQSVAIPADLDVEKRAWVINPEENMTVLKQIEDEKMELIGSYHMHHEMSWNGGHSKEIPTELDKKLGKNTDMIMFIVYMDTNLNASIRAFYEAVTEVELQIIEEER